MLSFGRKGERRQCIGGALYADGSWVDAAPWDTSGSQVQILPSAQCVWYHAPAALIA